MRPLGGINLVIEFDDLVAFPISPFLSDLFSNSGSEFEAFIESPSLLGVPQITQHTNGVGETS